MRVTRFLLGGHFGNLHKQYGEYRFSLAPNQQSAWKGFDTALINMFKEYFQRQWFMYVPPAAGLFLLYDWAKKENHRSNRKDPKEFENDT